MGAVGSNNPPLPPIRLLDTRSGEKRPLPDERPLQMYVCGVTPYDECHIGHARAYLVYDLLLRYLRSRGIAVHYVQNFTDVDDKIVRRAHEEGVHIRDIASRYIKRAYEDMDALRILRADDYPTVTDHMGQIIAFVTKLIKAGAAYEVEGDVYFDVAAFPRYGQLSKQSRAHMLAGSRVEVNPKKKNPLDFALWKRVEDEDFGFDSPWGRGRPGWHIECSALSTHYCGVPFHLHGGAIELAFPHHENELAQTEAATGIHPAVVLWVHCGLVTVEGQKMAKSLGNFVRIRDALARADADLLRFFLLSPHYRHPVDFSWENLEAAKEALDRLIAFHEFCQMNKDLPPSPALEEAAAVAAGDAHQALSDDLNTPKALAAIFELISRVRRLFEEGEGGSTASALQLLDQLFSVFGLAPRKVVPETVAAALSARAAELGVSPPPPDAGVEAMVEALLTVRWRARRHKDFAQADAIRKMLVELGFEIRDERERTAWRYRG